MTTGKQVWRKAQDEQQRAANGQFGSGGGTSSGGGEKKEGGARQATAAEMKTEHRALGERMSHLYNDIYHARTDKQRERAHSKVKEAEARHKELGEAIKSGGSVEYKGHAEKTAAEREGHLAALKSYGGRQADNQTGVEMTKDEQQRAANGQFGSGGGGGTSAKEHNTAVARKMGIKIPGETKKESKRIAGLPPKSDPGYNAAVAKSLGIKGGSDLPPKPKEGESAKAYNTAVAKRMGIPVPNDSMDTEVRKHIGDIANILRRI